MRLRAAATSLLAGVTIVGTTAAATTATTPKQAITKLRAAGLPIGAYRIYTASNDPNDLLGRPGQYVGKANFQDRRVPASARLGKFDTSAGGSIEVFASTEDAKRRYRYVRAVTQGMAGAYVEYDYLEGRGFLRLSAHLTPRQVRSYERAFLRIY